MSVLLRTLCLVLFPEVTSSDVCAGEENAKDGASRRTALRLVCESGAAGGTELQLPVGDFAQVLLQLCSRFYVKQA